MAALLPGSITRVPRRWGGTDEARLLIAGQQARHVDLQPFEEGGVPNEAVLDHLRQTAGQLTLGQSVKGADVNYDLCPRGRIFMYKSPRRSAVVRSCPSILGNSQQSH